jgi:hypothetical protein
MTTARRVKVARTAIVAWLVVTALAAGALYAATTSTSPMPGIPSGEELARMNAMQILGWLTGISLTGMTVTVLAVAKLALTMMTRADGQEERRTQSQVAAATALTSLAERIAENTARGARQSAATYHLAEVIASHPCGARLDLQETSAILAGRRREDTPPAAPSTQKESTK